jgi:hypothetical protein
MSFRGGQPFLTNEKKSKSKSIGKKTKLFFSQDGKLSFLFNPGMVKVCVGQHGPPLI